jgi:hypothetical protein
MRVFLDEARIIVRIAGIDNKVETVKHINMRSCLEKWVYQFIKTSLMHQKFCTLS